MALVMSEMASCGMKRMTVGMGEIPCGIMMDGARHERDRMWDESS
jgi:hypothetical protein